MYKRLFKDNTNPDLRAYVVWVPKLFAQEGDIVRGLKTVPDPRATHFWDGDGIYLKSYARVLDLPKVFSRPIDAWDIFMIYGPNDQWSGKLPPPPDFWMHQLLFPGIKAGRLDARVFAAFARSILPQTHPSGSALESGHDR
ncbi:MAG: hypothetical protein IIA14_12465 [SAR324 cluster bacterium]|nr:hypothetical protein [SAR324 cluster bacterium]